jgi:hypothetical protein
MNDEYLWNKTGNDAEIERLENALKAFRYKEKAPPVFHIRTLPLLDRAPRRFFRLSLAFGLASAAFVVLSIGWFIYVGSKTQINNSLVKAVESRRDSIPTLPETYREQKIATQQSSFKRNVVKVRYFAPAAVRPIKTTKIVKDKNPALTLTAEEKYAYDQLMLALSITSSKLKIVKDRVDGIDDQNAVVEGQR